MSTSAVEVNGSLIYILAVSSLLFILIVFLMVYLVARYRKSRNPVAEEVPDSRLMEAVWIVVPTLIVLTMFLYGLTGYDFLRKAPADALKVKVISRQWSWLFEYPNGKKSPDLVVPVGRNVRCDLTSADVIHGFYVPAYRIQMDAVPGLTTRVWFKATAPGTHYILCTQYCGLKHTLMVANLIAVPEAMFDAWLGGKNVRLEGTVALEDLSPGQRLLFEHGCVSCHSVDGGAMVGPTFKGLWGSPVQVKSASGTSSVTADDGYIRRSILDPGAEVVKDFRNSMPSPNPPLTDAEIGEIVEYLKILK